MRMLIAVVVLGVAGCAMTATEIQKNGHTHMLSSQQAPGAVATCVVKSAPEASGGLFAQVREVSRQEANIALYYGGMLAGVAVATIGPTGTTIKVSLWPYLMGVEQERVLNAFQGC